MPTPPGLNNQPVRIHTYPLRNVTASLMAGPSRGCGQAREQVILYPNAVVVVDAASMAPTGGNGSSTGTSPLADRARAQHHAGKVASLQDPRGSRAEAATTSARQSLSNATEPLDARRKLASWAFSW